MEENACWDRCRTKRASPFYKVNAALRGKTRTSTVPNSGDRLGVRTLPQTRLGTKNHRHMSDLQEAVCRGERGQREAAWGHYDCQLQTSEGKAGWWHHSQVEYLRGASGKLGPSPEGFSASPQAGEESPRPQMNDSFKRTRHTRNCTVKCCI